MPTAPSIFRCICTIAAATAILIIGQAPTSLAFAPTQTKTVQNNILRHHPAVSIISPLQRNSPIGWGSCNNALYMSENNESSSSSSLPVFLDPGTKGGAVVLSLLLFIIPIIIYEISTGPLGMDGIVVGRTIGVGFSVFSLLLWGSTYIFRVATKDMTYAKQLKDYEDAVIAKRLEELDEDEVQALVEDIERDTF